MRFELNDKLTSDPRDALIAGTHQGQAHFAGTGPQKKTCRECSHWRQFGGISHEYYAAGGKHRARLKPHPCMKCVAMMGGVTPKVPHQARACKYFEQADTPPAVFDPKVR